MNTVIGKIAKARLGFSEITKSNQGYDYKYADLDIIVKAIAPALSAEGLHFYHSSEHIKIDAENYLLIICHVTDGECEILSSIPFPLSSISKGRNPMQEVGKILTYGRRYTICAALGLTADQDTDGNEKPPQAKAAPAASEPLFVDNPKAWAWLDEAMEKENIAPAQRELIRSKAVGTPMKDIVTMIKVSKSTPAPRGA